MTKTPIQRKNGNPQLGLGTNALVAYFSHSGNTREIALQVQLATGASTFEIAPVNPYPEDYDAVVEQAKRELTADYRPPLKFSVSDLEAYDVIYVGSPNWWNTIAPPVMTFLSSHDFQGKTIVPFITHEGSGLGQAVQDVKRLSPGAIVLDGHAFRGHRAKSAQDAVHEWLQNVTC